MKTKVRVRVLACVVLTQPSTETSANKWTLAVSDLNEDDAELEDEDQLLKREKDKVVAPASTWTNPKPLIFVSLLC